PGADPGLPRPGDPALRGGGHGLARGRPRHLSTRDRRRQGGNRGGPTADRRPPGRPADGFALAVGLGVALAQPLRLTRRLISENREPPGRARPSNRDTSTGRSTSDATPPSAARDRPRSVRVVR